MAAILGSKGLPHSAIASLFFRVGQSPGRLPLAFGDSKMYHSDEFKACIDVAGLKLVDELDDIGKGYTPLSCKLPA